MKRLGFADRKLTHPSLERAMKGAAAYIRNEGWSTEAKEHGFFADLSRVEWCDLSATVRLVLFVESALREGVHVKLALPLPYPRISEQRFMQECIEKGRHRSLEEVKQRVDRRSRALKFLEFIEFPQALVCPHLELKEKQLNILHDYDPQKAQKRLQREEKEEGYSELVQRGEGQRELGDFPSHTKTFEHIFPLRWLSRPQLGDIKTGFRLRRFLAGILSSPVKPRDVDFVIVRPLSITRGGLKRTVVNDLREKLTKSPPHTH
jgi:hypothetical protein